MKLVSSLAIAAALVLGGAATAPAAAQNKAAEAAPAERKFELSKEARGPISELQKALNDKSPDFPQKLAAAQAVAKNSDDKYVIAKFKLQRAIETGDKAAQLEAVRDVLASGGADAAESAQFNAYLAAQALEAGDPAAAEPLLAARVAANPNDLDSIVNLARAKIELKKHSEGLELLQRAIGLSQAAGQTPPESWYRNALQIAVAQRNNALAGDLAQKVLQLYPSKENFNNLMAVTTPLLGRDEAAHLDLMRLKQLNGNFDDPAEYLRMAQILEYQRNWGEAKSVLEAAAAANMSSPAHSALLSKVSSRIAEDKPAIAGAEPKARGAGDGKLALSLADVYAGYGDYAKAAELYRLALQKGGVDANMINTRLGIAMAKAGNRAEAEAAFKAVTGPRAPLANLWLAWLARG